VNLSLSNIKKGVNALRYNHDVIPINDTNSSFSTSTSINIPTTSSSFSVTTKSISIEILQLFYENQYS
jgi:hypothetical protein